MRIQMRDRCAIKMQFQYSWIGNLLVFLLAAICIFFVVLKSNQSIIASPIRQTFVGEYSRDKETWYPLDDKANLDALDGDLFLRGHFSYDNPAGGRIYYYQNHIGVTACLNDELLHMDTISEFGDRGLALNPSMCGSRWAYIFSPGITTTDEIELRLHNPHSHGNGSAYRDFLNTLYNSPDTPFILETYLKPYDLPLQVAGVVFLIVALMLLGVALASGVLHVPMSGSLWKYGLLTLFIGGFVVLDTVGISFVSELVVFNTYARQLCMMLAVYCMGLCACDALTEKRQKTAKTAMLLSALLDSILIVLSFAGVTVIYDTGFCWMISQAVLCLLLIGCAAAELHDRRGERCGMPLAGVFLMSAVLLDMAGLGRSIYSHGTCTKVVFTLLFVLYAAGMAGHIVLDHQASIQAKQLKKELDDSRIAIMLSQIQPHFIYNTLGTVEQLCKDQPEVASELVHNFSLYLRGNFSELDSTAPILVSKEIEHVRHYADIEHIRFPDMEVKFQLDCDNFLLPALSVQPLVENAIKHGLMGLESGGTVTVSTYETDRDYCVSVVDDGVGFDPSILLDGREHIGVRNIRGRIEAMCGGTLTVESAPGKGTRAVITIPKERSE